MGNDIYNDEQLAHMKDRVDEIERLRLALAEAHARIALDNAVCLCGCPAADHEDNGEDGEQCEHEDHECLRVAPAVLEIVGRVRLALAEATREAADATAAANIRAAEHRKERDLRAQAERERDEARAERDRAATIATQEAVGHSRALTAISRARETEDGAVREAKERLWDALDRESLGGTYLAARGLRSALSSPPRPATKDDDKGGAA